MIKSFTSYYWTDTLAELVYHPPSAGARECWIDTYSQQYAVSYDKREMTNLLQTGQISEYPMGSRDIDPILPAVDFSMPEFEPSFTINLKDSMPKKVKLKGFEDDPAAKYEQFIGKDVVIKMAEGYEIYGNCIGVEPGEGGCLLMVEVVIYIDGETTPETGEAAVVDCDYIEEIREMSPQEQRQWIKDYTVDLTSEEVDAVVNMVNKLNGKSVETTKTKKEAKKKVGKKANAKKEYSVDLVNTDIHPDQLVSKMKIALEKDDHPALTMLFHGQPGTSKTQTAKYISDKLGKDLVSYNLGEIMSKWVGETEKKINEIFTEAKKEGHIILIDEIEGLTQDRSGAEKSWQMTHVNAFLQAIDEFDGIIICTTNFTDNMDKAFLRRFLLKAEFKNLTSEQAKKAAKKFFPKLRFRKGFEDDLYAPADFANIKNGFLFLEEKDITVKYVSEQLEKEARSRKISKKGSSACADDFARMGFNLKR